MFKRRERRIFVESCALSRCLIATFQISDFEVNDLSRFKILNIRFTVQGNIKDLEEK